MLDSSAPSVRRGKEREKPRTKRKSKMKKIILAERARKKELRKSKTEVDQQVRKVAVKTEQNSRCFISSG